MSNGRKYSEKEKLFLKEFVFGHTYKEICEEFNKNFCKTISAQQLKGYIRRHKLSTGKTGRFEKGHIPHNKDKPFPSVGRTSETQFKKGNLPHNTKFVGYERVDKEGYTLIRVPMKTGRKAGETNFVLKHRYIWELHNGPIPQGYIVIFLDGDKKNFDITNLALVSRAEHLELTRQKLRNNNKELTKTGILIVKNDISLKRKKGSGGNGKN